MQYIISIVTVNFNDQNLRALNNECTLKSKPIKYPITMALLDGHLNGQF